MTTEDRDYYYRRAESELAWAQRATCQPAVRCHVELAERYMALCGGDGDAATSAFRFAAPARP